MPDARFLARTSTPFHDRDLVRLAIVHGRRVPEQVVISAFTPDSIDGPIGQGAVSHGQHPELLTGASSLPLSKRADFAMYGGDDLAGLRVSPRSPPRAWAFPRLPGCVLRLKTP